MTRRILPLALLGCSALTLAACGQDGGGAGGGDARAWIVDHDASTLTIAGDYGANPFDGTFEDWSAEIVFAPDDLAGSSIVTQVRVASLATGDADRDGAAGTSRWLNAEAFPTATWRSTSIAAAGASYVAQGEFTVAGVTSPLALEFTVDITGDQAHAVGGVAFDHHDVGITGGYDDPDTGDIFAVSFDIRATTAQ